MNVSTARSPYWMESRVAASHALDVRTFEGWDERSALIEEARWREARRSIGADRQIATSRWAATHGDDRSEISDTPHHCHVVSMAVRASRVRLATATEILFEGLMAPGTVHVSVPGERLMARFTPPFDFLHFHVDNNFLLEEGLVHDRNQTGGSLPPFRDPLAETVGRSLLDFGDNCHPQYVESISKAIVVRALMRHQNDRVGSALPKWRLRKLDCYLETNMGGSIDLQTMADAAGLSRMHFAAQFRAATGFRPHEYLLLKRIEKAKVTMTQTNMALVEVALSVGFSAQAHFSTVFKRFTGKSPARWKREFRSREATTILTDPLVSTA
jgi:AraC family transcriptional regulator